jgi:hypothetical protein
MQVPLSPRAPCSEVETRISGYIPRLVYDDTVLHEDYPAN